MRRRASAFNRYLMIGVAGACLIAVSAPAQSRPADPRFRIAAQPLDSALRDFGVQSGFTIMADASLTNGKSTTGYSNVADPEIALRALLRGTGLNYRRQGNVFIITRALRVSQVDAQGAGQALPQATEPPADMGQDIIVTAQRREESLQDVPLSVTAVSGRALDEKKIESGGELVRAAPNVNFSKSNFSSFNFSIRGIGTKAISASSDPAVAVSFNSTPLIRSRLFEQEFFDIQRVEVLRGPQGTLYGRNATGGVVNILPALPSDTLEGNAWIEAGNYGSMRTSGMLNVPLTETLAVRVAGAFTYRDGFDYNSFTNRSVNGRDLYSTRVSAQWEPSDNFSANVIWQHFSEDDNRSRSGKALCTRDPGPTSVGDVAVPETLRAVLSQGCRPGSLYDDAAYGAPNGSSFPNIRLGQEGILYGFDSDFNVIFGLRPGDPYAGVRQSRDLREIATAYDPEFRAKNDVVQLNLELGLGDGLRLFSQSLYTRDRYYQTQDYYRFVSDPIFTDSANPDLLSLLGTPYSAPGPTPGGIYVDPQLGASDRVLAIDLSRSRSRQYSQEFRLQSDWEGPINFSLGGNYLDFKSQDDYYVFNNTFSFIAEYFYNFDSTAFFSGEGIQTRPCQPSGPDDDTADCVYVDPNSLDKINELGRNYFLSRNLVETRSKAIFGELYYDISDSFKLTAGLRYTDDTKIATPVPSQLLLGIGGATGPSTGGLSAIGYPKGEDIRQRWRRFSGRLVADWKPELSFTNDKLIYASFAHGYKGGGTNPPRVAINPAVVQFQPLEETFAPEYVNAFEIGTKNSFDNGRLTLNLAAFYYDYKNYQVSQIVDRISLNENFDARSMGIELEAAWRPTRNFQIDANFGFLDTRIADGESSINVMDRTQGNPDWVVVRPFVQVPSNCVAPVELVQAALAGLAPDQAPQALAALCGGSARGGSWSDAVTVPPFLRWWERLGTEPYNPLTDGPNGGRGFDADLGGNELPNAPHYTANIGAQYTLPIGDWSVVLRGDYYRQGASYARVYNTEYDRLRAWDNLNLTLTVARPADDFAIQFYIKNVFDDAPITDVFTNSDDTGLTSNIFTLDPRLFAVRLSKRF
jgi:outer membrane receptor protein involved in Fe transport